ADHLFLGLAETLTKENVLYQGRGDAPFATGPQYDWIAHRIASEPSVHAVVLSAFWGKRWRRPPAGQTFEDALRRTVETFTSKGKNVVLVANTPSFQRSPRPCKYMAGADACHPPAPPERDLRFLRMLRKAVAGNPRATVFDPRPLFSDERGPTMERDGRVVFRDRHHLNAEGSRLIAARIAEAIAELRRDDPR
ncbi:MAG: SGNH hydrolase domain-containing protein, partial [Alphaproteobacteria bacterium]